MATLEEILKDTGLFDSLTQEEFQAVVKATTRLEVPAGSLIAQEGEVGNECYIILAGSVQVYTTTSDGEDIVLIRREPGEYIGEQALLPGSSGHRNASLRAQTDLSLLRITKQDFQRLLSNNSPLKDQLQARGEAQVQDILVRQSALFRSLKLGTGGADGEAWYREVDFEDGAVIFRQGDPGREAYLIITGTADVFEEDGDQRERILQLGPGRTFGERALLEQQPRSATIIANGPLKVLIIDGEQLLTLYDQSPEVREYMQMLKKVYPMAGRGFATQYIGKFMDMDCLTTVSTLVDGTTAISSLVIGQEIFNMSVSLDEGVTTETIHFADPAQGIERELVLLNETIVGITSRGQWDDLGRIYRTVLEQTALRAEQIACFQEIGRLERHPVIPLYQDHETVCHCLQITRGELRLAIDAGSQTAEELMEATGAGTVCGACRVSLREMVGQADWTPVRVTEVLPVASDIRTFRFVPQVGSLKPAKPGQHIVVQAQIEDRWVQRPYTISSAADETGYREITVKREPHGLFSNWLFDEKWQHAPIRISDPQGDYYAEPDDPNPVVCLVGGIGVTPALAMSRSLLQNGNNQALHIDYSVSTPDQFVYIDELQAATENGARRHLELRATRDTGRITRTEVQALTRQYPTANYFICGPTAYQTTVETYLKAAAVPRDRIQVEEFTPVGEKPVKPTRSYLYLGTLLILAFALQDLLQLKWPWLETIQATESFRRWSGVGLTLYLAAQFILPAMRWRGSLKSTVQYYHLHKIQGAFAPLIYYVHATDMGYAYLLVLSIVYFANFLLGLLNQEIITKPQLKRVYQYYWLIAHILLSLLTVGLVAFHIYIVFAYQ